jgi:hypothetical protein
MELFRYILPGRAPVVELGDATVVSVTPESSTIRVDRARDAAYIGDSVGVRR